MLLSLYGMLYGLDKLLSQWLASLMIDVGVVFIGPFVLDKSGHASQLLHGFVTIPEQTFGLNSGIALSLAHAMYGGHGRYLAILIVTAVAYAHNEYIGVRKSLAQVCNGSR